MQHGHTKVLQLIKEKMNEKLKITIDSITAQGEGIGRYENYVIFVPHAVPGDYVEVSLISKKSSYARALISKILDPSPFRIKPLCPKTNECGGCQLQEMNYNLQLVQKEIILKDAFIRIAGVSPKPERNIIPADFNVQYRNKCQYPVTTEYKKLIMGYYAPRSHKIINYTNCSLHPAQLNKALNQVKEILEDYKITGYNEKKHKGIIRHIIGRFSFGMGNILIGLVTNEKMPNPKLIARDIINTIPFCTGVIQNINTKSTNVILGLQNILLAGESHIKEIIGEMSFYYSLPSFFQINTSCAQKLYDFVLQMADIKGTETIIDAYSGVGAISLFLARKAKKVYAIEEIESAVKDAIFNAKINNIKNCFFVHGRVENILPQLSKEIKPDLIILDPPREGVSSNILELIANIKIPKIIYISCHPGTLARDTKILLDKGYSLSFYQGIDMFPHTYHIETVAMFQLKS